MHTNDDACWLVDVLAWGNREDPQCMCSMGSGARRSTEGIATTILLDADYFGACIALGHSWGVRRIALVRRKNMFFQNFQKCISRAFSAGPSMSRVLITLYNPTAHTLSTSVS